MSVIVPCILTDSEEEYHNNLLKAEHVADLIQVDIIDGKFADNTTVGVDVVKKYLSSSMLEIQLLVEDVTSYIEELAPLEYVSRIIIPFEIDSDVNEAFYHIKGHGKQTGLSINPSTSVKAVFHFLDEIDLLTLMAVEPGFSGQKLQKEVFLKIDEAKRLVPDLALEVDGGVNFDNAQQLANAGVDFLIANSVLFGADDFMLAHEKLAKLATVTP
ncbi:MAG: hypothetical protein NUV69_03825 [Candidatus Curtissbacteria bacterium]|nr:hypothetical protein [Candidatus Curtissbacteria bacterium]